MAQSTPMGPPLSPRETRRSGRRSAHSASASASKSPDSDSGPRPKEAPQRPPLSSNNSSSRGRRPKQEDVDDSVEDRKTSHAPSAAPTSPTRTTTNGRTKRKGNTRERAAPSSDPPVDDASMMDEDQLEDPDADEAGVTRCVCGSTEDDPDAGEFMVQCETCNVWQHGLCMGYESEDQLQFDDYYCELCRPDMHVELLKKSTTKKRHSSSTSHHTNGPTSRISRSRSPTHFKQHSKRRNTMNSQDAAFDANLEEVLKATAAEAGTEPDTRIITSNGKVNGHTEAEAEEEEQTAPSNGRKKRRRIDDDLGPKKRPRSMSATSDHPARSVPRDMTPVGAGSSKGASAGPVSAPAPRAPGRNKRGGGRKAAVPASLSLADGGDAPASARGKGHGRGKGAHGKRGPHSAAMNKGDNEHSGRRNQSNGINGQAPSTGEGSRAYRNSHAYVVSQQALYTSWGLPDYLAHLEDQLPTQTPQPLEITAGPGRGDSIERTVERGVKVKWPSKRMSVGDMNKRVRSLVEWVGREQANASDRERRRDALQLAKRATSDDMVVDNPPSRRGTSSRPALPLMKPTSSEESSQTMRIMEELMEELIRFQERFGPGSKNKDQRRAVAVS